MLPRHLRPLLAVAAILVGVSPALAQRTELEQLRKPTTVPQFWKAMKAEIAIGKFDTAAGYLKGMLALNPTDKDLLAIEEQEGIASFLDLNNIPSWSSNEAVNKEAKANVQKLIDQVTAAVKTLRSDSARIQKFIRNLTATPEEHDYAFLELRKSGASAMPQLIGTLQNADLRERAAIIEILPRLTVETVPPLLAAFDITSPALRVEFLNVLEARPDILQLLSRTTTDPRPTLWHLSAGKDLVASKAKLLLSAITRIPVNRLPFASTELIKAAEDIYQHRDTLAKEGAITLWRYDGRQIVSSPATPSQAEEYYGLRYARWALELEPRNEAAQVVFLNIATEKAFERAGLEMPLAQSSPAVHQLLAEASASVLYTMLDRALREDHRSVALGVIQVIGERAEVHGNGGFDPLLKALTSQDRRLAIAAADALIRLPGNIGPQNGLRIIDVYRAALAAPQAPAGGEGVAIRPRALIVDSNTWRARLLAGIVEQAGFEASVADTGREALVRLNRAADIDVLWVNSELTYPMLPDFLSQVRADYRYGRLPLFVTVSGNYEKARLDRINLALDQLEAMTRDWLFNGDTLDSEARLAIKAQTNNEVSAPTIRDSRQLILDRSKYPIRVELHYDALRLTAGQLKSLTDWLTSLHAEHPDVRQTTWARQRMTITIAREIPGLNERLRDLTVGISGVVARRVSESLFTLDFASEKIPDELSDRIADLLRDYTYETKEGVRSRILYMTREIPTDVILTSMRVSPPQRFASVPGATPAAAVATAEAQEVRYNAAIEEGKVQRAIPSREEARLRTLLASYRNVELIAEPLDPAEIIGEMRHMTQVSGPMSAPLSENERKQFRLRAIEALRRMATGSLAGYDVRPAQHEILEAMQSDDLAPAAIEASGRLPGLEPQQEIASVLVNTSRPAHIRKLAADELVRIIQRNGVTSISDGQIAALTRLVEEEKSQEVKAGISLVLGALPRDRVLKNLADPKARAAWLDRLQNYQPSAPAAPAPKEGT